MIRTDLSIPAHFPCLSQACNLTNYDLDALVQIEAKGLGLVFRAASTHSYQAAKLVV